MGSNNVNNHDERHGFSCLGETVVAVIVFIGLMSAVYYATGG